MPKMNFHSNWQPHVSNQSAVIRLDPSNGGLLYRCVEITGQTALKVKGYGDLGLNSTDRGTTVRPCRFA